MYSDLSSMRFYSMIRKLQLTCTNHKRPRLCQIVLYLAKHCSLIYLTRTFCGLLLQQGIVLLRSKQKKAQPSKRGQYSGELIMFIESVSHSDMTRSRRCRFIYRVYKASFRFGVLLEMTCFHDQIEKGVATVRALTKILKGFSEINQSQ